MVSGQNDPSTCGEVPRRLDPDYAERLFPLSDRVCPRQMTTVERRRFRKWSRRFFVVNFPANFPLQITYIGFLERIVSWRFVTDLSQCYAMAEYAEIGVLGQV